MGGGGVVVRVGGVGGRGAGIGQCTQRDLLAKLGKARVGQKEVVAIGPR